MDNYSPVNAAISTVAGVKKTAGEVVQEVSMGPRGLPVFKARQPIMVDIITE